ncbi:hypothetical protein BC940DRAFT_296941 [Gongronella butleri]|nr:hypothetical protein BC940DRAFT_296941 [Gongronella butleri]
MSEFALTKSVPSPFASVGATVPMKRSLSPTRAFSALADATISLSKGLSATDVADATISLKWASSPSPGSALAASGQNGFGLQEQQTSLSTKGGLTAPSAVAPAVALLTEKEEEKEKKEKSPETRKRLKPMDELQAENLLDLLRNQMFAAERQLQKAISGSTASGIDVDVWAKRNKDAVAVEAVYESTRQRYERLFPFNRRFFSAERQREEHEKELERQTKESEVVKTTSERSALEAEDKRRLAMLADLALKSQLPRMTLNANFDVNSRVFVSTRHFFSEFEKYLEVNGLDPVMDFARFLPACLNVPQTMLYEHAMQISAQVPLIENELNELNALATQPATASPNGSPNALDKPANKITKYQYIKDTFYNEFDAPVDRLDQILAKLFKLKQKEGQPLDPHCRAFSFLMHLARMHDFNPKLNMAPNTNIVFLNSLNDECGLRFEPAVLKHVRDFAVSENHAISAGELETRWKTRKNKSFETILNTCADEFHGRH